MFASVFRGFVFLTFMFWYSIGIWNYINAYFSYRVVEVLKKENETLSESYKSIPLTCGADNTESTISTTGVLNNKNVCNVRDFYECIFNFNMY